MLFVLAVQKYCTLMEKSVWRCLFSNGNQELPILHFNYTASFFFLGEEAVLISHMAHMSAVVVVTFVLMNSPRFISAVCCSHPYLQRWILKYDFVILCLTLTLTVQPIWPGIHRGNLELRVYFLSLTATHPNRLKTTAVVVTFYLNPQMWTIQTHKCEKRGKVRRLDKCLRTE